MHFELFGLRENGAERCVRGEQFAQYGLHNRLFQLTLSQSKEAKTDQQNSQIEVFVEFGQRGGPDFERRVQHAKVHFRFARQVSQFVNSGLQLDASRNAVQQHHSQ